MKESQYVNLSRATSMALTPWHKDTFPGEYPVVQWPEGVQVTCLHHVAGSTGLGGDIWITCCEEIRPWLDSGDWPGDAVLGAPTGERMGMCPRPAVPQGKANWKAWKISHFLHLKEPLRTVAATGRHHPASAPWLWPKFHGEMLKNKVDSFEGVVEGEQGREKLFSQTLKSMKTSGKWSVWFSISQNKRIIFLDLVGKPLLSSPAQALRPNPAASGLFLRIGSSSGY